MTRQGLCRSYGRDIASRPPEPYPGLMLITALSASPQQRLPASRAELGPELSGHRAGGPVPPVETVMRRLPIGSAGLYKSGQQRHDNNAGFSCRV